jgi:L-threonylcarbamoyladenylate synthase
MVELGGKIPLILDGGPCEHGLESTILWPQMRGEVHLQILRPGPITAEMLAPFGQVIAQSVRGKAPGSLESHYAPRKKLFWYQPGEALQAPQAHVGFLAFSKKISGFGAIEILSPSGDLVEAASNLYGALRRLDESTVDFLLVEPVPQVGIGNAMMDRLRRAVSVTNTHSAY